MIIKSKVKIQKSEIKELNLIKAGLF